MSLNEASGFVKTVTSSSESSDSESFLQEDIKSSGSLTYKQWEVIERTLYQEPGEQVTDPALLKECKLWRETFPHFRIKGTRIDVNKPNHEVKETDKNVQTLKNHFNLKKLEEKRESIKKKVVGVLVERLIAKYGLEKEKCVNLDLNKISEPRVQITEIVDETSSNFLSKNTINKSVRRNSATASVVSTDKESYFERGKELDKEIVHEDGEYISVAEMEKNLCEIFDSWENDYKDAAKLPKTCDSKKVDNPTIKCVGKQTPGRFKPIKFTSPNTLSNLAKPFELTTKIDKKYEGLIEKIMERKQNEFDAIRHCRKSASGLELKSYQETLEKLRKGSGFNEYLKRKEMPKINKFNNNWLKRTEMNYYNMEDDFSPKTTPSTVANKFSKNFNSISSKRADNQDKLDEKFMEELKKEMFLNFKRPAKKSGVFEEINLQRPKPFAPAVIKTLKSSSCRDLTKKNKKETSGRQFKSKLEMGKSESNLRNHVRSKNLNGNKGSKSNALQNSLLPPIETGIICTELTGRPKIGLKNPKKRY